MKKLIPLALLALAALAACSGSDRPVTATFAASSGEILTALSKQVPDTLTQDSGYDAWQFDTIGTNFVQYRSFAGVGRTLLLVGGSVSVKCIWASSSPTLTGVTCDSSFHGGEVLDYLGKLFKRQ